MGQELRRNIQAWQLTKMKLIILWGVSSCSLVQSYQRFGTACLFPSLERHKFWRWRQVRPKRHIPEDNNCNIPHYKINPINFHWSLPYSALDMEIASLQDLMTVKLYLSTPWRNIRYSCGHFNLGAFRVGWSTSRPGRSTANKQLRYQRIMRLGRPRGLSGGISEHKISYDCRDSNPRPSSP